MADKTQSLREKLRARTQSFRFDALLQNGEATAEGESAAGTASTPAGAEPSSALVALIERLGEEIGGLRAYLQVGDPQEAGVYLARLNYTLSSLNRLDPYGEQGRKSNVTLPAGGWPLPVWTQVELLSSPLAIYLPPTCGEELIRELLRSAWGVFHTAQPERPEPAPPAS